MPNLKEVRDRISSVDSTMQITQAMKMITVAKLSKARSYFSKVEKYLK